MRLFWVLSPVGWGAGIQKHCFLSLPLLPSHAPWWIVYATYLLLHLCCTFRPIIAPTWDCTQDNVGIFDNTDCETETLFWINKQRRLELLERNPRFFPPHAARCIISNMTFHPQPAVRWHLSNIRESSQCPGWGIGDGCLLKHALAGCCDLSNPLNVQHKWHLKRQATLKARFPHSLSCLRLKACDISIYRCCAVSVLSRTLA